MSDHAMIVPPSGPVHLLHLTKTLNREEALTTMAHLEEFDFEPLKAVATIPFEVNGEHVIIASWIADNRLPLNERARKVVSMLTGVHILFFGPVLIEDLSENVAAELVGSLSMMKS